MQKLLGCRGVLGDGKRIITGGMIDDIQQLLREDLTLLLGEIGKWLAHHDQPIATTALHINLQDLALTHKRLKRVAAKRDVHTSDLLKLRWPMGFLRKCFLFQAECSSPLDYHHRPAGPKSLLRRPQLRDLQYCCQCHL